MVHCEEIHRCHSHHNVVEHTLGHSDIDLMHYIRHDRDSLDISLQQGCLLEYTGRPHTTETRYNHVVNIEMKMPSEPINLYSWCTI